MHGSGPDGRQSDPVFPGTYSEAETSGPGENLHLIRTDGQPPRVVKVGARRTDQEGLPCGS
jgi:hypothetical protein